LVCKQVDPGGDDCYKIFEQIICCPKEKILCDLKAPYKTLVAVATKAGWTRVFYKPTGAPDKVRRNTCEEVRPSRLDVQRDKVKIHHVIAST
jgi:hypothetical protein